MNYLSSKFLSFIAIFVATAVLVVLVSACRGKAPAQQTTVPLSDAATQLDTALFSQDAMVQLPEIVACTLENGDASDCAKFVVKYLPDSMEIGPFCPPTLNDVGGVWNWDGENAGLYRLNEGFFQMLDGLGYRFFDDDGTMHIAGVDGARPEDDHACINMSTDETVEMTVLLPVTPIMAAEPTRLGVVSKVGLALDGVPIFSDAPSVQHTGHLPALDTCGGHVDPGGWYHFHGTASDIDTVFDEQNVDADCRLPQDSAALFGYAFDGFPIYGSTEQDGSTPIDLDACNGHEGPMGESGAQGYHYHASTDFPNLPSCLSGVVATENFVTTAQTGIGAVDNNDMRQGPLGGGGPPGGGPPGGGPPQGNVRPDFSEAAAKLGVSEAALSQAIQAAGGRQADLAEVARELGIDEADLREALPPRSNP